MSYRQIATARPRIPATVQRAVLLMRVGAACATVSGVFALITAQQVQDRVDQMVSGGLATPANSSPGQVGGNLGIAVDICCWLWMAKANKDGKNWARITGTVFFGIYSLGIVLDLAFFDDIRIALGAGMLAVTIALWAVNWLVGLTTLILLWNRNSGPHFRPAKIPPPAHGPGYLVPPTTATMEDLASLHEPPADPWSTPDTRGKSALAGPRDASAARSPAPSPVAPNEDDEAAAFRWL